MAYQQLIGLFVCLTVPNVITAGFYKNYSLESDSVCSYSKQSANLILGKEDRSAILVYENHYFDRWSGKQEFKCKFSVTASFNLGVFAVIQKMSLRRNATTGECIDYIQFRRPRNWKIIDLPLSFKTDWGPKVCGQLERSHEAIAAGETDTGLLPNAFRDDKAVEVRIHVGKVKLEPNENIDIEIAFTAFTTCKYNRGNMHFCANGTCIFKEYFNDGIINCPFPQCVDENGCSGSSNDDKEEDEKTKVMLTAAASVIISFVMFLGLIWICRTSKMSCSGTTNGERGGRRSPAAEDVGSRTPVELTTVSSPTAPPCTDKDLPPPYESLFPDR